MTFLEFVANELLGAPVRGTAHDPFWDCPSCGGDNLHVLPNKRDKKDRYHCFSCGVSPDAAGLIKLLDEGLRYPEQLKKVVRLRKKFRKYCRSKTDELAVSPSSHGFVENTEPDRQSLNMASCQWDRMLQEEETSDAFGLQILNNAKQVCEENGISIEALVEDLNATEKWLADGDARHIAECTDPDCEAAICRRDRGWTEEEIQQDLARTKSRMRATR